MKGRVCDLAGMLHQLYPLLLFSSLFLSGIQTRLLEEQQLFSVYGNESHTSSIQQTQVASDHHGGQHRCRTFPPLCKVLVDDIRLQDAPLSLLQDL